LTTNKTHYFSDFRFSLASKKNRPKTHNKRSKNSIAYFRLFAHVSGPMPKKSGPNITYYRNRFLLDTGEPDNRVWIVKIPKADFRVRRQKLMSEGICLMRISRNEVRKLPAMKPIVVDKHWSLARHPKAIAV
jgi:hypothetical protein